MQFSEGRLGRIFVLRLEEGEQLNDSIEKFAREQKIDHGLAFYLGGAGDGSGDGRVADGGAGDAWPGFVRQYGCGYQVLR